MNDFGNNLRTLRKSKKLTLQSLGKALNISKSTLSDYETGRTSPPIDVCKKIVNFFGTTIDKLEISDISENINKITQTPSNENPERVIDPMLVFNNKILIQQVEGLQVQLKLVRQITDSKDAEIRSLKMQIQLLGEKLSDYQKQY
jgi:transcriptional regulator with XRE-family HTH domain